MFGTCTRASGSSPVVSDAGRFLGISNYRARPVFGGRAQTRTALRQGRDLKRKIQLRPDVTTCVLDVNQETFETEVLQVFTNTPSK
jgi:hypothetical protein